MTAGETILVDGDARAAVEFDLSRNLFVEAGAGTGKTTVLVRRVVRLLATGAVPEPSGLVAITFTEAAAAQLRDRIREALERAAVAHELSADERARCAAAVRRIDEAVITTLHGFAQRILAEHPLASRLPPAFEVEEGVPAELDFVERFAAFIDELLSDPELEADLEIGVTLGLSLPRLSEVARALHDRWDRLADVALREPAPAPSIDASVVLDELRAAAALLGDRGGVDDRLVALLEDETIPAVAALEEAELLDDRLELLRMLDAVGLSRPGTRGQAAVWGTEKAVVGAHLLAACDAREALLVGARRQVIERLLPRLVSFTTEWADERRRQGRLHFHDLLVHARDLVWRDAEVRQVLARRYAVLLVDEFQDTDPLQIEIVMALAAADPARLPARWDEVELAPAKVLVVGDPKQSIYGFRGADIALWNRTRDRFGDGVVHLSQNFRSVESILAWVNAVFDRLIGEGDGALQPSYSPLQTHLVNLDDEPAVVTIGGPAEPGVLAGEVRLREAAGVAAAIRSLKAVGHPVRDERGDERPVRFADVAILLPTRAPLGPIERALDDLDVPYRVESRSLVWTTDAVREVLALLAAVEDPADEVAVVAALRTPAFACRDDELADYRAAGGRWDHSAPPPDGLDPEHPVVAALAVLNRWHERRFEWDVDELIEVVIRDRRLIELTLAQRRPRDHWRRLRFVADQARAFVDAGGASLADFLGWARVQTDEGAAAVETVVPEPDDDAVRILTVHGSKGLEFPVVVLAGLSTGPPPGGPPVRWSAAGPEVSIPAVGGGARFETAGFAALGDDRKRAEANESIRLLYVAATRARDQLVVSVHHKPTNGREPTHAQTLFHHCQSLAGTWRPAPVVDAPALLEVPGEAPPPSMTAAARDEWIADRSAVLTRAVQPWSVAPTALAGDHDDDSAPPGGDDGIDDDAPRPFEPRHRGGTAVGRAVHAVLEVVDLAGDGSEIDLLARRFAGDESVDDWTTVAALARSAFASDAVAAARVARRVWRELLIAAPVNGRLLEGYVDLLYETADGDLVVVDWKTDRARSEAEVDAALDRYRLQGAGYVLAIETVTGRRPVACRFVFCRADGAVERELTDLDDAVAAAREVLGGSIR